ncbi:MAG TPA: glycoside hydrolase family 9 protein [Opitutaceae bacterium]|nr:glycoside hydrolase family 9 protein [Opitutaceae bacterium]
MRFRPTGWFAVLTALLALCAAPGRGQPIDDGSLRLPVAGDYSLHILTPSLLELTIITSPGPDDAPVDLAAVFHASDLKVTVDGAIDAVDFVGFKRRVLYAPVKHRDLRVATAIYAALQRKIPMSGVHPVTVEDTHSPLWPANRVFKADTDRLRYSPAIHVNQEGYTPGFPKVAMVGYFIGTLGELPIPADAGFDVVDAATGKTAFHGPLLPRPDVGFHVQPKPYQRVYQADFTKFDQPGVYRLLVPGLGASLPFRIDPGELMNFARTYELGLYHQRCGTALTLPYTRFTHAACHTAPADVPMPPAQFPKSWEFIASAEEDSGKGEFPDQQLKYPDQQLYPYVRLGKIDVSGGHHDAGDYSKYTIDSAALIHSLMFAVDSLPGVAALDNLGIPESGDGISDVMQEAKWESDFLAKMQDKDGGFYFLVYPRDRRYEDGTPDHGDPQIVWPKNTSATAAAVAALAQCASSPTFKKQYPKTARRYLAQAELGWKFLDRAIARYGRHRAYQRLTHYGDAFQDTDELAWAACELFLATGDEAYERKLFEWYPDPTDPRTRQWEWHRAVFSYGNVLRSYAFAARSGRLPRNRLDAGYLEKCEAELRHAGEDALHASEQNAYGVSYPEASKRLVTAGWFFPSDEAFDMTVAYQLEPLPQYPDAVLANLNYEAGCNPVNRCFLTGIGVRRQREIVHQYAQADGRVLPPSGLPLGALQSHFYYMDLYKTQLRDESWPKDDGPGQYPLYDRWSDAYNLSTEFVIVNQGRALASIAYWAAQTPLKTQPWKSMAARITAPTATQPLDKPLIFRLECPGLDLTTARIVWEGRDQEPAFGPTFTMIPREAGPQWVEAEAALPDGRRVFAHADFRADAPVVLWVDGALPRGASPYARGGDNWNWIKPASKPAELAAQRNVPQHESALARGIHEHGFNDATETLSVGHGDILFAYCFIDPRHPPKTIMLEWNDGSQEHRAFWGPNLIPWGHINTPSQWPMGPVPPAGRWIRLEVPAKLVGLEGHTIKGMVFRTYDGRMRWDACGKMTAATKELGLFPLPPSGN